MIDYDTLLAFIVIEAIQVTAFGLLIRDAIRRQVPAIMDTLHLDDMFYQFIAAPMDDSDAGREKAKLIQEFARRTGAELAIGAMAVMNQKPGPDGGGGLLGGGGIIGQLLQAAPQLIQLAQASGLIRGGGGGGGGGGAWSP